MIISNHFHFIVTLNFVLSHTVWQSLRFALYDFFKTTQHWSFLCLVTQEGQKDWITAGMCKGTSVLNISTSLFPAVREIYAFISEVKNLKISSV